MRRVIEVIIMDEDHDGGTDTASLTREFVLPRDFAKSATQVLDTVRGWLDVNPQEQVR